MSGFLAATKEALIPLQKMIREGRLFAIQEWIDRGNPLHFKDTKIKSALVRAIDTGFHSILEILLRAWRDQETLDEALCHAIAKRKAYLAWPLLDRGADMNACDLESVAQSYDKDLVRYYINHWDRIDSEDGILRLTCERVFPITGLIREFAQHVPDSKVQLTQALKRFIHEQSAKWVSLSIWMGADPRLRVPDPDYPEDDEGGLTSPIQDAARQGRVDMLKSMKVSSERDDLNELLSHVSLFYHGFNEVVEYIVDLGADVNNRPDGGSSILTQLLTKRKFDDVYHGRIQYASSRLHDIRRWVESGARFVLDDKYQLRPIRELLLGMDAKSALTVIELLYQTSDTDTVISIARSPKTSSHLGYKPKALLAYLQTKENRDRELQEMRSLMQQRAANRTQTRFEQRKPRLRVQYRGLNRAVLSRSQLYERVWSTPVTRIAKELGLSDVGLAKTCRRYDIPRPGRGHWARAAIGSAPKREPLNNPDWNPEIGFSVPTSTRGIDAPALAQKFEKIVSTVSEPGFTVEVPLNLTEAHPLVRDTLEALHQRDSDPRYQQEQSHNQEAPKTLAIRVQPENRERALRIMNAAIQLLDSQGIGTGVIQSPYGRSTTVGRFCDREVPFALYETNRGLCLKIESYSYNGQHTWRDCREYPLEVHLAQFACTLAYIAAVKK